jgi:formamidopyrimidine-DNA glycosylase
MPELPEVEIVRRGLEPVMAGIRIASVEQHRPDLRFPLPAHFAARLKGRHVLGLGRRAKYLIARLDRGEALIMHLGMTGRFRVSPSPPRPSRGGEGRGEGQEGLAPTLAAAPHPNPLLPGGGRGNELGADIDPAHDHIVFRMGNGAIVTYNDPRRFGYMDLIAEGDLERHKLFAGLGAEPLGNTFTPAYLASRAVGRATDLKAFLLDQRIIAGLGNIYVCEALHRAGLSPNRGARCLALKNGRPTERAERLVSSIRSVLEDAIAAGGSTLRDYRHANGALGEFQHSFQVYGREGEPCKRTGCRGIVRRTVQGGRSTFYCSMCQR